MAVQTSVFEGPFDLLLHLILREQVDIYEVSLSRVVDAYLEELGRMPALDLETATEFLLIAATLVELKSKRLLPQGGDVEADEELGLWAERDLLLARLLECKTFKDAAATLERRAAEAERSFPRTAGLEDRFLAVAPDLLAGVTAEQVRDAFIRAASPRPLPRVDMDHVAPIRASVRDALDDLAGELPRLGTTTFRQLTLHTASRLDVIVRFLAVLELYKQGLVELGQQGTFASIEVRWLGAGEDEVRAALEGADSYDG